MASRRRAEGGVTVDEHRDGPIVRGAKQLNRSVKERNRLDPHTSEKKPCMNSLNTLPSPIIQASNIFTMLDASLLWFSGSSPDRAARAQW